MTETHYYECDRCNGDLTTTGGTPKYRITVSQQSLPHEGGYVHAVIVRPPLQRSRHFCSIAHLVEYFKDGGK